MAVGTSWKELLAVVCTWWEPDGDQQMCKQRDQQMKQFDSCPHSCMQNQSRHFVHKLKIWRDLASQHANLPCGMKCRAHISTGIAALSWKAPLQQDMVSSNYCMRASSASSKRRKFLLRNNHGQSLLWLAGRALQQPCRAGSMEKKQNQRACRSILAWRGVMG